MTRNKTKVKKQKQRGRLQSKTYEQIDLNVLNIINIYSNLWGFGVLGVMRFLCQVLCGVFFTYFCEKPGVSERKLLILLDIDRNK